MCSGTGKSYVINAILQQAKQKYPNQEVVQIVSPTGAASKQFTGGKTIHAYLKLLVSKNQGKEKHFDELGEAKAQQLERDLAHLRLLIIDEKGEKNCDIFFLFLMIYYVLGMTGFIRLYQIDSRLKQARPAKRDQPFGGISVMIAGDLRQLPPVFDMPLYEVPTRKSSALESHGYYLYHLFNTDTYQLVDQMRQQGDHNQAFRQDLADLAVNKFTEEQHERWRQQMCPAEMRKNNPERWQDFMDNAIMLAGRKADLIHYNEERLMKLNTPIALSSAVNRPDSAKTFMADKAGGLVNELFLARGSRVLLTRNLWSESGLVNGAHGFVRYIIYREGVDHTQSPPPMPDLLLLEVPGYTGESYLKSMGIDNIVPILPMTHVWATQGHENMSRMQFPLLPGYGITIHKAQGKSRTWVMKLCCLMFFLQG